MEGAVDFLDEGAVDVGVDPGGDDRAVAEHLLHGPEVGTALTERLFICFCDNTSKIHTFS